MLVAGLVSAGLAGVFAWTMGRRIAAPMTALAAHARTLAAGEAPEPPRVTIEEVREVRDALVDAGRAIHEREVLRDREQVALKAADKAKDEFLAMLGHELRNPLSAITASAYVVRVAKPGEQTAMQAHGVIDRQTRHMTRLIDDLLDVSRLAMGKVSLRLERFDLGELARRVAQVWQHARVREPRELDVDTESAHVDADRSRIEQVITNLLDNADKFSPPGRRIELCVRAIEGQAVLTVVDHGQGIEPAIAERIFEAFVQGPQDVSRAKGGIGLGLTLVKRLVEMHAGTVEVFSEGTGKGARFTVRLPLVAGATPGSATQEPARHVAARRILVIEDNEDGRAMMEALLELEGHEVRTAADGASGVATALEWQPDVVLIDIGLPDFDGREVARRLRAADLPAKLVAVSGYGQPEDERRSRQAGFDLHLTKPIPPDRLRSVLQALMPSASSAPVER
jgi:signal transduction histidine kinase/CheY-like chemotaxis protein